MSKSTAKTSVTKGALLFVLLISFSLITSDHAFLQKKWSKDCLEIGYDAKDTAVVIAFQFYDYNYVPLGTHAYLEWVEISYSKDGVNYYKLMTCVTYFQKDYTKWSEILLTGKLHPANLRVYGTLFPASGSTWDNGFLSRIASVFNIGTKAKVTVKWFLHSTYEGVKWLQFSGKWNVKSALHCSEVFNDEIYEVPVTGKAVKRCLLPFGNS